MPVCHNGSSLSQLKVTKETTAGNGSPTTTTENLNFTYDASGTPMTVTHNGTTYYYVTNLQGDVTDILNSAGTAVVSYTYDAWGNIRSTTGTLSATLGKYNPLRYRGYVYDTDTKFYYLQSRYYNPDVGRFINADIYTSTGQGFEGNNMFAYCGNNPVARVDIGGYFWWDTVLDVISLVFSVIDVIENPNDPMAWLGLAADVASLAIPGVTGGGTFVRAATKADDIIDAAKTIDKVDDVVDTGKAIKNARANAVRKAWKNEVKLVETTGVGTRAWTDAEIDELLKTGKVKGYEGHHMKSVQKYPHLAGDPSNIQFLTREKHLLAHGGSWRNITCGRYIE